MTVLTGICGAKELIGKGVYRGMPLTVPTPVRNRRAVVVGETRACAVAARQLGDAGWTVTVVSRDAEVVCAAGIDYLEALVVRRIKTGRIEAFNASALFVL